MSATAVILPTRSPGGARIALNFALNYEEGSEYSIMDEDGASDAALTELPSAAVPRGDRDLAAESMFEYGSLVGFWRLHRLFKERNLPMTIYACALALERNRPAAQAIKEAGYDICRHGWRWIEHFRLDEATEREHIRVAIPASAAGNAHRRALGRPGLRRGQRRRADAYPCSRFRGEIPNIPLKLRLK